MSEDWSVSVLINQYPKDWEVRALEQMVEETRAEIDIVIVENNSDPESKRPRFHEFLFERGAWGWYWAVRAAIRKILNRPNPAFRKISRSVDEIECLQDAKKIKCSPIPMDGFGNRLPENVINVLETTDIGIRFAFGVIKGDVLSAPNHGILSYHHADIRKYRGAGGIACLLDESDTRAVTLQRISETLDGGEIVVLNEVDISDTYTWQEANKKAYEAGQSMLSAGIKKLQSDPSCPFQPDELGPIYKSNIRLLVHYLIKNNVGKFRRLIEE